MTRRGRPPTGRSTKVCRVPNDMDMDLAVTLYYDIHPKLLLMAEKARQKNSSPRWQQLIKALEDLGYQ